jgi:hypothetical protein
MLISYWLILDVNDQFQQLKPKTTSIMPVGAVVGVAEAVASGLA